MPKRKSAAADKPAGEAKKPMADVAVAVADNAPAKAVADFESLARQFRARELADPRAVLATAAASTANVLGDAGFLAFAILLVSDPLHRPAALDALARLGAVVHLADSNDGLARLLVAEMAPEAEDVVRDHARNRFFAACGALQQVCFELGKQDWAMGSPSEAAKAVVAAGLSSLSATELDRIADAVLHRGLAFSRDVLARVVERALTPAQPCIAAVLAPPEFELGCTPLPPSLQGAYASPSIDRLLARLLFAATRAEYAVADIADAFANPAWTQLPHGDRGVLKVSRAWAVKPGARALLIVAQDRGLLCDVEAAGNGMLTVRAPLGGVLPKRVSTVVVLDKPGDADAVASVRCLQALARKDLSRTSCVTADVAVALTLAGKAAAVHDDETVDFGHAFASAEHVAECFPHAVIEGTGSRFKVRFEAGAAVKATALGAAVAVTTRLSPAQMLAVRAALSRAPVVCVRGPRGCGKTAVAAQVVASLLARGDRIGVLCPTRAHLATLMRELAARPDVEPGWLCDAATATTANAFSPDALVRRAKAETTAVLATVRALARLLLVPDVDAAAANCDAALWFLSQARMQRAWTVAGFAAAIGSGGVVVVGGAASGEGEEALVALTRRVQQLHRFQLLGDDAARRYVVCSVARVVGCTPESYADALAGAKLALDVVVIDGGVDQTLMLVAGALGSPKRVVCVGSAADSPALAAMPRESVLELPSRPPAVLQPVAGFPSRVQRIAVDAVAGVNDATLLAAEHAVALFMFARAVGHSDVAVVAASHAQRLALHKVLKARCAPVAALGMPRDDVGLLGGCLERADVVVALCAGASDVSALDGLARGALLVLGAPGGGKAAVVLGEFAGDDLALGRGDEYVVAGGPTELSVIAAHMLKQRAAAS